MQIAARAMVTENDGRLELTPDVSVDELRTKVDPPDANFNLTALTLSSLLLPIGNSRFGRPMRLAFAHRAFQEFFLAESLYTTPDATPEMALPDTVLAWLQEMRQV